MQLDKTRIVVRERGVIDTLDLALHVLRIHFVPLCTSMLIGALPWAVINYLLIGWMLPSDWDAIDSPDQIANLFRYAWTMTALVSIEMPIASIFSTVYLGKALFVDRPPIRDTFQDVFSVLPRLIWFHLLLRGIVPAICLVVVADRVATFSESEILLMFLFLAIMLRRLTAPFLNEIILLERNPIRSQDPNVVTIRKRSAMLYGPASGNVLSMTLVVAVCSVAMAIAIASAMMMTQGIFFNDWEVSWVMLSIEWPLAMWITATFATVTRFLSYLDLRIRFEGWEVELRIRAEGNRLAEAI